MSDFIHNFVSYVQEGAAHATGANPIGLVKGGGTLYEQMGYRYELDWKDKAGKPRLASKGAFFRGGFSGALAAGSMAAFSGGDASDIGTAAVGGGFLGAAISSRPSIGSGVKTGIGWGGVALSTAPIVGFSGYAIYQGYKENGMAGARDAAVWDIATNAAVRKFAYQTIHPEAAIGATQGAIISRGMLATGARFMGAGIGASIGQAIGDKIGLPGASIAGAFAGAYVGAAPLKFAGAHPIIGIGAVVAGGLAATGYGAYEVMKMGYAQKQSRKGIQTSGDLAAFMTAGANTMRARAVQAIQKSHTNGRSALGMEANFMSYSSRNYFSQYRA